MSAALKIAVRDIAGVERADLDLVPGRIALVGGLNESGKTSLIEAVAAALTAEPLFRVRRKKDVGALVRDGATSGRVTIERAGGSVTVAWPSCEIETSGANAPAAPHGPVTIGARPFSDLDHTEQRELLIDLLEARPTQEDLAAALSTGFSAKVIDGWWKRIERDGWDAACSHCGTRVREEKGAWRQVTGQDWGSAKAEGWSPEGLDVPRETTVEALEARVAEANAELERAIAGSASSKLRVEQLKANIAELESEKAKKTIYATNLPERQAELAAARRVLAALPSAVRENAVFPCLHCNGRLVIRKNESGRPVIEKAPDDAAVDDDERQRRQEKIDKAQAKIANLEAQINQINFELVTVEERLRQEPVWQAELVRIESQGETTVDVDAARRDLEAAKRDLALLRKRNEAAEIQGRIARGLVLKDALSTEGVRARKLRDCLGDFNAKLKILAAGAKISPIEINDDMTVIYGGRPLALASESGRWRANLIIACVLAQISHVPMFLVDRLDIVHAAARGAIVRMLTGLGMPVIACMTARDRDALPPMESLGMGLSYWIDGGKLEYVSPKGS